MKKNHKVPDPLFDEIMPHLIGVWRRFHQLSGPPDVLQTREFRSVIGAINHLQKGLFGNQELIGQDYFAEQDLLGAYLLYYWTLHYAQGLALINELPSSPGRVLDVCSGPAPFAFAALRHGASEVIATDRNLSALKLGSEVCGRYGFPITIRKWDCLKQNLPVEGSFDLIILGHCLEELFPTSSQGHHEKKKQFVQYLLQKLTPNGFLLIADSSLQEPNRHILQLRDDLVKIGVPVQAPCVWKGECPALQTPNSPCYAQREFDKPYLIKEFQRAAQINLSSLKMSYIIFKNPKANWPQLPEHPYYRIISPPVDAYQGKRYYLCGTDGKKMLESRLAKHPPQSKAFDYLRRGELISVENALSDRNALHVGNDTTLSIEAACSKPIPEIIERDPWEF